MTIQDDGPTKQLSLTLKVFIALASLVSSTELHEAVHLLVGRLFGIPTHFLNFTAVGISKAEAALSSPAYLALMNGAAPIFSILVLGFGSLTWLKSRRKVEMNSGRYFVVWLAIFNVPYLGLQMMTMGTVPKTNGTGNDFATVFDFLGMSSTTRAILAVVGYIVFVLLQIPVSKVLFTNDSRDLSSPAYSRRFSPIRDLVATLFFLVGLAMAIYGNYELCLNRAEGINWIMAEWLAWGLSSSLYLHWRTPLGRKLFQEWVLPGILAVGLLFPLGLEGNDFLTFWLFLLPIVTGASFFRWSDEEKKSVSESDILVAP